MAIEQQGHDRFMQERVAEVSEMSNEDVLNAFQDYALA